MSDSIACESCGMPMQSEKDHAPHHPDSAYCVHCSSAEGNLQEFEERFERMVQWQMQRSGETRPAAELATRAYMRNMPAWKNHPALQSPQ